MKSFSKSQWKHYLFLKQDLNESKVFLHEIIKKLDDRCPNNIDHLLCNKVRYEQHISDIEETLRLYNGIEQQYNNNNNNNI